MYVCTCMHVRMRFEPKLTRTNIQRPLRYSVECTAWVGYSLLLPWAMLELQEQQQQQLISSSHTQTS